MTRAAPTRLPDAEARQLVTASLSRNLFVEAGAGSGKTTALVTRVVNLVAAGTPIGRIAAITFTEAAARELRTRIRDELERRGEHDRDPRLLAAAGEVASAPITTLHGFARRLLADHPIEAGLPPGFEVADEVTSMLDFDDAWRAFTGRIGDDLDLIEVQERASVFGVELRRFVDIARRFDDNWDLLDRVATDLPPLSEPAIDHLVDEIIGLEALVDHCLDPSDLLAAAIAEMARTVASWPETAELVRIEWLEALSWPPRNRGRKGNWVRMDIDDVRCRIAEVRDAVEIEIARYRREVIDHYVVLVARFVAERVAHRRSEGRLAYHDLLVLARRLLRTQPQVRETVHQRYRHVLLDEFQDTDPIQIELAVLIAAAGDVGASSWQELAAGLDGGRLVVVGDPKQSIYRFRRADIEVYAAAEESLSGGSARLAANFRSVPGVVEWVNRLFAETIGDGEPGRQPAYATLAATRAADPELEVPVRVFGGPHEGVPVGEIREIEAADVAAVVCRAMEEEWRVERDGRWLPVRLSDIAVLIPSRLSLPALESAFGAANVPFRPETSSLVYATQEVRDVLAAVRAVVDPSSAVDVVAALRSGLFAVGDDELTSWYLAGGSWDYTQPRRPADEPGADPAAALSDVPRELAGPVAAAFTVLRAWHAERWWIEPAALIERIVRERRLREAALAEPRPRDRWRRYRFLAEQARQFTATKGGGLTEFVAWAELQASDLARVTEPIPPEPDDDAVRVLTVHGSKGLEFPMVVLAGAPTQEMNRPRGPQVLFPRDAAPEVALSRGKETARFDVHASVEEILDQHERIRLQYVAATRARDLLVVSAHHKLGLKSSGARIWAALDACDGSWDPFERRGDERYEVESPTQLRLSGGDHGDAEREWRADQERIVAEARTGRTRSATALADELRPVVAADPGGALDPSSPSEADPEVRRRAVAFGLAVHGTLELLDLADPQGVATMAKARAAEFGVPDLADEVARYAVAALASPSVELARTTRHWRELYVAAPVGDGAVEGYIDLVVDGPDGLVVVDYKTNLLDAGDGLDARVERYRHQAAAYAVALGHVTGRPIAGCRLVFVGPGGVEERAIDDIDSAIAEVRAALTP